MLLDFILWIPETRKKLWKPNDDKGLQFIVKAMRANCGWHSGCFTTYTSAIPQRRLVLHKTAIWTLWSEGNRR
jgi:hypothetical protein